MLTPMKSVLATQNINISKSGDIIGGSGNITFNNDKAKIRQLAEQYKLQVKKNFKRHGFTE